MRQNIYSAKCVMYDILINEADHTKMYIVVYNGLELSKGIYNSVY